MKITTAKSYSFHQMGGRDNQEDSRFPDNNMAPVGQEVFIVCDGVGGCERGEVASNIVASTMGKLLSKIDMKNGFTDSQLIKVLDEAYMALDNAATNENDDMGTTLTLLCLHGKGAHMVHIGDSRIYHIRPHEGILYRSNDHSLVNQMVHSGQLTPEEAINHPQSNVITRCMSPTNSDQRRSMATVFHTSNIESGDYVLLCSDGVLHCCTDDELIKLLESDGSDEQKAKTLAELSKKSTDNNTAWIIPIKSVELTQEEEKAKKTTQTIDNDIDTAQSNTTTMSMSEIESVARNKKSLFSKIRRIFG